jgi:hypothetical protein
MSTKFRATSALLLSLIILETSLVVAQAETAPGYVQANSGAVYYRITKLSLERALASTQSCSRAIPVEIYVAGGVDSARNHSLTITNGTDTLFGSASIMLRSSSGIESWQPLNIVTVGCVSPRWRRQTWGFAFTSSVSRSRQVDQITVTETTDQNSSVAIFLPEPNRVAPKITVATLVPGKTSATLLVGSNSLSGEQEFTYQYRVSGQNNSKFPTTWKSFTGQVTSIKGLKTRSTYKIYVRAVAPDKTTSSSKLVTFKTK